VSVLNHQLCAWFKRFVIRVFKGLDALIKSSRTVMAKQEPFDEALRRAMLVKREKTRKKHEPRKKKRSANYNADCGAGDS